MLDDSLPCMCVKCQFSNFHNVPSILQILPKNINNLKRGVTHAKIKKLKIRGNDFFIFTKPIRVLKFQVPTLNGRWARSKIIQQ